MSRNLGRTDCRECPGEHKHILLEEPPRPAIVRTEANGYEGDIPEVFGNDYAGLLVAKARCVLCHTLYLAWVDWPGHGYGSHFELAKQIRGQKFCDLSYRHSFNDEPRTLDLPVFEVETVTVYKRRPRMRAHSYFREEDAGPFKQRWEETVSSGRTIADELAALPHPEGES